MDGPVRPAYAADAAGYAYAIGGWGTQPRVASVERYDSVADSWTNVASLPAEDTISERASTARHPSIPSGGRTNVTAGTETAHRLGYT